MLLLGLGLMLLLLVLVYMLLRLLVLWWMMLREYGMLILRYGHAIALLMLVGMRAIHQRMLTRGIHGLVWVT